MDQIGQFNPGAGNGATISFSISISDDIVVENTESFYVQLVELDSALQVINPNRSTVLIQDNDGKCSTLEQSHPDSFSQKVVYLFIVYFKLLRPSSRMVILQ